MFTVNIQSTTVSGITLSMSFSASNESELKSKVQESIEVTHKDVKQLELPLTKPDRALKEEMTKAADTTTKLDAAVKESSIEGVKISDLDKDGRPWDERIDGPLKTKNQFGKWKAKPGVNKTTRIRIIEELKINVKPESTPVPALDTQAPLDTQETNQVETPAFTVPEEPPAERMTLEHFKNNFATVMSELYNSHKISVEKTGQLCEIARVKNAWEIPLNETSLKAVYMNLIQENLL